MSEGAFEMSGVAEVFNKTEKQSQVIIEWVGMPEFVQNDLSPYKTVKIHFRNKDDEADFFCLINQRRTKRNSYWYPEALPRKTADKRYIDEP